MKSAILWFILISCLACSNTFEVAQTSEPTTFVYAILEASDSVHLFRINKSFIAFDNAMNYVGQPDSLCYQDIIPWIELFQNNEEPLVLGLEKILLPPKDSGIFAREPNIAYAMNQSVRGFTKARLCIRIPNNHDTVFAETRIVKPGKFLIPGAWTTSKEISFFNGSYALKWESGNGYFNSYSLTFHYREFTTVETFSRSFGYVVQSDLNETGLHDFLIRQSDFLYTIKSRIPDKNDVIVRIFDSIDFRIQSAERFLYDFANLQRSNPAEFALINFTNIQNGSGIFSSKATSRLTGFRLDFRALDSLVTSPLTRHLRFVKY